MGIRQRRSFKYEIERIQRRIGVSLGFDGRNQAGLERVVGAFRGSKDAGEILGEGGQARVETEILARLGGVEGLAKFGNTPYSEWKKNPAPDAGKIAIRFKRLDAVLSARRQQREGTGVAAQASATRRSLAMSKQRLSGILGADGSAAGNSVLGGGT